MLENRMLGNRRNIVCFAFVIAVLFATLGCESRLTRGEYRKTNASVIEKVTRGFEAARKTVQSAHPGTADGCVNSPRLSLSSRLVVGNTEVIAWQDLVAGCLHKNLEREDPIAAALRVDAGPVTSIWRWNNASCATPDVAATNTDSEEITDWDVKLYENAKKVDHLIVFRTRERDVTDDATVDIHLLEFPTARLVCSTFINAKSAGGVTRREYVVVRGRDTGQIFSTGGSGLERKRSAQKAFSATLKDVFGIRVRLTPTY